MRGVQSSTMHANSETGIFRAELLSQIQPVSQESSKNNSCRPRKCVTAPSMGWQSKTRSTSSTCVHRSSITNHSNSNTATQELQ